MTHYDRFAAEADLPLNQVSTFKADVSVPATFVGWSPNLRYTPKGNAKSRFSDIGSETRTIEYLAETIPYESSLEYAHIDIQTRGVRIYTVGNILV